MSTPPVLVTGATGLLGSHLAEQLARRAHPTRALVRPGSRTDFLESLGVELVRGDLTDPSACAEAVREVGTIYHAAAKVGDWGTWAEFQSGCLDATRNLAGAATRAGVHRFVHISSTSAYGHPTEGGPPVPESAPLGQNLWPIWDDYTRSKVEQERLLWEFSARSGLPLTVIRPSWLFGVRDRTTTARMVDRLRRKGVTIIGRGANPLSAIDAAEVASVAILAGDDPGSVGEAYNVTDLGHITQSEYLRIWAEVCGVDPTPRRPRPPYSVVFAAALGFEAFGRAFHRHRPPLITRYATWLLARDVRYSTEKARIRLGWRPTLTYRQGIERTVRWYLESNRRSLVYEPGDASRAGSSSRPQQESGRA